MVHSRLSKVADQLHLKKGNEIVWGTCSGMNVQISFDGQHGARYTPTFVFKRELPDLIERFFSDPRSKELKLNKKLFKWTQTAAQRTGHLTYNFLTYAFKDRAAETIEEMSKIISDLTSAEDKDLSNYCEGNKNSSCTGKQDKIRVINNHLTFVCSRCLEQRQADAMAAKRAFDNFEPNYILGALFSVVGAFAASALWELAKIGSRKDYLILAIIIGVAAGFMYKKGASKIDVLGKVIIAVATVLAVFAADIGEDMYLMHKNAIDGWNDIGQIITYRVQDYRQNPVNAIKFYLFPIIGMGVNWYGTKEDSVDFRVEE